MTISACVVVDPQCGFSDLCPSELPVAGATELPPLIQSLMQRCNYSVVSKEAHAAGAVWITEDVTKIGQPVCGHASADVYWPAHCLGGTKGAELLPGMPNLQKFDLVIYKGVEPEMHPYGACYHDQACSISTGLIEFLRAHEVEEVLVCGLATDYCVKETCLQLLRGDRSKEHKFKQVILCIEACRGVAPETTEAAVAAVKEAGGLCLTMSELQQRMS